METSLDICDTNLICCALMVHTKARRDLKRMLDRRAKLIREYTKTVPFLMPRFARAISLSPLRYPKIVLKERETKLPAGGHRLHTCPESTDCQQLHLTDSMNITTANAAAANLAKSELDAIEEMVDHKRAKQLHLMFILARAQAAYARNVTHVVDVGNSGVDWSSSPGDTFASSPRSKSGQKSQQQQQQQPSLSSPSSSSQTSELDQPHPPIDIHAKLIQFLVSNLEAPASILETASFYGNVTALVCKGTSLRMRAGSRKLKETRAKLKEELTQTDETKRVKATTTTITPTTAAVAAKTISVYEDNDESSHELFEAADACFCKAAAMQSTQACFALAEARAIRANFVSYVQLVMRAACFGHSEAQYAISTHIGRDEFFKTAGLVRLYKKLKAHLTKASSRPMNVTYSFAALTGSKVPATSKFKYCEGNP